MVRGWHLAWLVVWLTGCWSETAQTVRAPPLPRGRRLSAPAGSSYVTVVLTSADAVTRADVAIARACHVIEQSELRAVTKHTRYPTALGYLGPGTLIVLGGLTLFQNDGGSNDPGISAAVMLAGAGLYALVFARSGTYETTLPPQKWERPVGLVQCRARPAAGVDVDLRGREGSLTGRTNRHGIALMHGDLSSLGRSVVVFVDGMPVAHVARGSVNATSSPSPMPQPPKPPTGVLPDL